VWDVHKIEADELLDAVLELGHFDIAAVIALGLLFL
jgi:hypothetical protein